MKTNIERIFETLIILLLILFGVFIAYQIIKKTFGGSWSTEDIIISILIFNLGAIFTVGLSIARLSSDHKHLSSQFKSLANDFKEHTKK